VKLPPDHFIQMDKVQLLNIDIDVDESLSLIGDPVELRKFLLHQAVQSMAVEILRCGYYTMAEGERNAQGVRTFNYSVHVIVDEAMRDSVDDQVQARVSAARDDEREKLIGILRSTAQAYQEASPKTFAAGDLKEANVLNAVADLLE